MREREFSDLNAGSPRTLSTLLKAAIATTPSFSWRSTKPSHEAQGGGRGGGRSPGGRGRGGGRGFSSGGRGGGRGFSPGGRGGGRIRMTIEGETTIGAGSQIVANGANAPHGNVNITCCGAGAGGTVILRSISLSGTGPIGASGGDGYVDEKY